MPTDADNRRAIVQRAIERTTRHGLPVDPMFVALAEQWITGAFDLKQMRLQYLELLAERVTKRRPGSTVDEQFDPSNRMTEAQGVEKEKGPAENRGP